MTTGSRLKRRFAGVLAGLVSTAALGLAAAALPASAEAAYWNYWRCSSTPCTWSGGIHWSANYWLTDEAQANSRGNNDSPAEYTCAYSAIYGGSTITACNNWAYGAKWGQTPSAYTARPGCYVAGSASGYCRNRVY